MHADAVPAFLQVSKLLVDVLSMYLNGLMIVQF